MSLDTIINGYFRSGTTIFWQIVAESNPDYAVFYEPCNTALFHKLRAHNSHRDPDPIHEINLWDEYFKHDELIERLRWAHPNLNEPFPTDYPTLEAYAEVFHRLPSKVILQTNRWQFHLACLHHSFDCKIIHIIRNPISIFRSVQEASLKNRSAIYRSATQLLSPILQRRAFRMDSNFGFIWKRYGIPPTEKNPIKRIQFFFNAFDQHFIAWIISNYVALKQLEKTQGLLICYEDAIRSPVTTKQRIEEHSPISFDKCHKLREDPDALFLPGDHQVILDELAKSYALNVEWEFIKRFVDNNRPAA